MCKMSEVKCRVIEAFPRDVDRGIVRLSKKLMSSLDLRGGDVINILGRKTVSSIVWSSNDKQPVIRMDGMLRKNANVGLDDFIIVEKIEIKAASDIVLEGPKTTNIEKKEVFFRHYLQGRAVSAGDQIRISRGGSYSIFKVKSHSPEFSSVLVTPSTKFSYSIQNDIDFLQSEKKVPKISYEDIGGLFEQIQRLREMIELPIRHPKLFEKLGVDPPKGVLLYGPPGTGKTILAKAVARESEASFHYVSGPEFISSYYGESEAKLREIFKEANEKTPSIIFFDEIDSIAPHREQNSGELERRIVAQLLVTMDGLDPRGRIVVIGATNRIDAVDPALRRPGRFDREIEIGIPNKEGRLELLEIHTRNMPLDKSVQLVKLAEKTHGFVGADIAALTREAGLKAAHHFFPDTSIKNKSLSHDKLDSVLISQKFFVEALKEIIPTTMREIAVEIPEISWETVGGIDHIKQSLLELVEWPLRFPDLFKKAEIRSSRGILLHGPPGTGKTLLVKALASKINVNFILIRGPELVSKYIGETEKALRNIFKKAKQVAPSICFFDEIDSIAPSRLQGHSSSGFEDRVVSTFLTAIDGFESLDNVILIAATNRLDAIDPALLRPGRFDHLIEVPLPDSETRIEILHIYLPSEAIEGFNLNQFSTKLEGMTGADIEAICQEVRLIAIRRFLNKYEGELNDSEINNRIKEENLVFNPEDIFLALKSWNERQEKPRY